jgi:hypothetical protein
MKSTTAQHGQPNSYQTGRDSSVGTASRYRAGKSADRIPVRARFSTPVQTGPGTHPASCAMGTGSLPRGGVKRLGSGVNHQPHIAPKLKQEYRHTPTPPLGLHGLLGSNVPVFIIIIYTTEHGLSPGGRGCNACT